MPKTLERLKLSAGTHTAPAEAFRFRTPLKIKFAKAEDGAKVVPITILARTADVVDHWYFGPCIHDMAGVRFKDKIPLDWNHWHDVNVGFADKIKADPKKGLQLGGQLISLRDDDKAADIIGRGKLGVPYEFSIEAWQPWRLEFVPEGFSAECNGRTVEGPCTIFREWTLKAGAVCIFGVDDNTSTNFSRSSGGRDRDALGDVEFTLFSEPNAMTVAATKPAKTTDTPADDKQALTPPPTPPAAVPAPAASDDDPAKQFAAKLAKFTAKFGPVNGSKWAAEGKNFEEALDLHATELAAQSDAKDKQIEDLTVRLNAVDKGEPAPVSNDGGKPSSDPKLSALQLRLGENLGKVAASLKMPGKK